LDSAEAIPWPGPPAPAGPPRRCGQQALPL